MLERISGPLADALTGGSGSERILHELESANMFVTALDVGRSWFRYHPLFADLLRLELRRVNPTLIRPLHAAAARWHEQHGDVVEAIRHAQAAGDWPHAAGLLADNQLELILGGYMATVRALLDAFPADVAAADPELALAFALARLYEGLHEEAAAHVAVAERLAAAVGDDRRRRFELGLAVATLWSARVGGDLSRVPDASRRVEAALKAQLPSDVLGGQPNRATALLKLGIAQMWSLRSDDGRGHLEEALSLARRIGRPYLEMACLGHLALAAPVSGQPLAVGRRLAEEAVAIAEANGWDTHRNAAPSFAAAGTTLAWLGRFPEAERCLDRAERALAPGGAPEIELLVNKGRALVRLGQRTARRCPGGVPGGGADAGRARERAPVDARPEQSQAAHTDRDGGDRRGAGRARRPAAAGARPGRDADRRGRRRARRRARSSRRSTSWSPSSSARRGPSIPGR